jgi:hypothetical protein
MPISTQLEGSKVNARNFSSVYAHNEIVSIWTQQCSRPSEIFVIICQIEAVEGFSVVEN